MVVKSCYSQRQGFHPWNIYKKHFAEKVYNTFGIDKKKQIFFSCKDFRQSFERVIGLGQKADAMEVLILGGGSNILLTQDLDFLS